MCIPRTMEEKGCQPARMLGKNKCLLAEYVVKSEKLDFEEKIFELKKNSKYKQDKSEKYN